MILCHEMPAALPSFPRSETTRKIRRLHRLNHLIHLLEQAKKIQDEADRVESAHSRGTYLLSNVVVTARLRDQLANLQPQIARAEEALIYAND